MEVLIRAFCFVGMLVLCLGLEFFRPLTARKHPRHKRWGVNLGLSVLNGLCIRLSFGAALFSLAQFVTEQEWGFFHLIFFTPLEKTLMGLVLLDLALYLQHVAFHAIPVFWRLHQVHHTDLEMDVSTSVRFHPLEVMASLGYKSVWVMAFGIPPLAVLIYEALLNMAPMFHHSNFKLSPAWGRHLQNWLITPDVHRMHHSVEGQISRHNFGVTTSLWDRLFGTFYNPEAEDLEQFKLGLEPYTEPKDVRLLLLLALPFRRLK